MTTDDRPMTVPQFTALKGSGRKITMLTAYDFPSAQWVDAAEVEGILVGDSLATVLQGHANTLPVTLDEMIYHAELVGRAVRHALVVVDLPFPSFHLGVHRAIDSAGRILKQTRCQAVKLEGGVRQAEVIAGLVAAGIPVMAHCGLQPQNVHQLGRFRVQRDEDALLADVQAVEEAGAFAVVLECIPAATAERITAAAQVPTIGIGAGAGCDGQILVLHDLLGLAAGRPPRHVRPYADLRATATDAIRRYRDDVRAGRFPGPQETPQ
jgi:3-methyl-2-oxobutanoate hydroxymethyltransferase